jgi:alkylation response protein AidB-like acyl-CoA dehydrogenase
LDGDEGFAEVFFDDAFLPDASPFGSFVLGEPGAGWSVAMATAGTERGLTLRSPGRFVATVDRLIGEWRKSGCADLVLRDRIVRCWMRAEAYRLYTLASVTTVASGGSVGAEASINKLWWSELALDVHACAMDLLGPAAEREGPWSKGWEFSLAGPIYAGTNEIQRNIAAERLLGLPRSGR